MFTNNPGSRRNTIQSLLWPCVLKSDEKYFNLSIIHLELIHILNIIILYYFLQKLQAKEEVKTRKEADSIDPSVTPSVTTGAKNHLQ